MRTLTLAALALWTAPALAVEPVETNEADDADDKPEMVGPSTTDPDVKPEAPTPEIPNPAEDLRTYAGVGSGIAYAERGVAEIGGSGSIALSQDLFNVSLDPSIGYFLWDNVELSGQVGVRHITLGDESSNQFSLMAEPSLHFPITDGLFWAGGIGAGVAFLDTSNTDLDMGFAFAPRTGVQLLLGRSGLLNVGGRYSMVFSDVDANIDAFDGATVLAFQNTFDIQAGYTVMF
jgi:hypothetical protein